MSELELIEKVAKQLGEDYFVDRDWEDYPDSARQIFRDLAAEVIACIKAHYRSEIERAGEVGIDPHNYTNPTATKIGIAMQQTHILKIFEEVQ